MNPTTVLGFSLRQLQYVLAVAEEGGFGRAAARCAVSQPSLSAQVGRLEELWGVRLFDRAPGGTRLTRQGEALLPRIRRLLEEAGALQIRAEQVADPEHGVLRIGVIPTVAPYLLPRAVRRLREALPGLTVHWLEDQTARIEDLLLRGDLDAGLIADPPRDARLAHRELGRDPFVLLVPRRSRGAATEGDGPRSLAELDAEDVLLLGEGHCLRDHALALCVQQGAHPSPWWATSLPTLVQMVGEGLGVTLLPQMAVEQETARASVRVLPLREPAERVLQLAWRARDPREDLLRGVGEALAEALAHVGPVQSTATSGRSGSRQGPRRKK